MTCEKDYLFYLLCYYMAKTELYDRTLTDMRGKYDTTSAYIDVQPMRGMSSNYAKSLYNKVIDTAKMLGVWDAEKWRWLNHQIHYTAQEWIDVYNHLNTLGKMDFLEAREVNK